MDEIYKVFALVDSKNRVVNVDSDAFLNDTSDYVQIDEGTGYRYKHAQANYLSKPKQDSRGVYRYALVDRQLVERTQEEMDADYEESGEQPPQQDDRIAELEKRLAAQEAELAAYREAYMQGVQSA